MGLNGSIREYEIKYITKESLQSLNKLIDSNFTVIHKEKGTSTDIYWKALKRGRADFIRLRYLSKVSGEITVKHTDKKDISDRLEIDLPIGSPIHGRKLLTRYLGKEAGHVKKSYVVHFLDNKGTNISVYKVHNDGQVFVEIESYKTSIVKDIANTLTKKLSLNKYNKSLYSRYVKKKKD